MKVATPLLPATILITVLLSACATVDVPREALAVSTGRAQMIPAQIPLPVRALEMFDAAQNKRVEKDVLSLTSEQIRSRLTSTETIVTVQKRDSSGSLSYLGAGGKVAKGSYRVTFDYANYTNQNIKFDGTQNTSAIGRIGVGLRITAEVDTLDTSVDLGGLLPIAIAAADKKATGRLQFYVYGISNDKVSLAVPSDAMLDASSVQNSFQAAATVRTLFALPETKLEPYLIGVADIAPVDAPKALEAAQSLVK